MAWARRCGISSFVELQRTIVTQRTGLLASIEHGLLNSRIESIKGMIRLITRMASGFKSPDALIALAMLKSGRSRTSTPGSKLTHSYVRNAPLSFFW